jgi:hypothetical protein
MDKKSVGLSLILFELISHLFNQDSSRDVKQKMDLSNTIQEISRPRGSKTKEAASSSGGVGARMVGGILPFLSFIVEGPAG